MGKHRTGRLLLGRDMARAGTIRRGNGITLVAGHRLRGYYFIVRGRLDRGKGTQLASGVMSVPRANHLGRRSMGRVAERGIRETATTRRDVIFCANSEAVSHDSWSVGGRGEAEQSVPKVVGELYRYRRYESSDQFSNAGLENRAD